MTTSHHQRDLRDARLLKGFKSRIEKRLPCRCLINEPLSSHTSWRVGGLASLYIYPDNIEGVVELVNFCHDEDIPTFYIGYGTNLLISDRGIPGCVIDLAAACRTIHVEEDYLISGAGVWLHDLAKTAAQKGMQGLEKLAGIPGGVGGGMTMNCGAFGGSISDTLESVEVIDARGNHFHMSKADVGFGYRTAPGLVGKFVLEARFKPNPENPEAVIRAMEETVAERYRRNVMTLPSAGSVFKNPPNGFAAKLLDSVGAKGTAYGGVEVSMMHANFIVNTRGGNADDVLNLVKLLRKRVMDAHNVKLELEVKLVGFEGEDPLE